MQRVITASATLVFTTAALGQGAVTNGDSHYANNAGSVQGSANWQPDNAADHLFENWWAFRAPGDATSQGLHYEVGSATPNAPLAQLYIGNTANVLWSVGSFMFSLSTTVIDGANPNTGELAQMMTVTNNGPVAATLELFNYMDFDVDGADGDSAAFNSNIMTITDAVSGNEIQWTGVNADRWEIDDYSPIAADDLQARIDSMAAYDLSNSGGFVDDDFTGAFQWSLTLGVGESFSVESIAGFNHPVPAPGALALLGLAAAAPIRRKRRRCAR